YALGSVHYRKQLNFTFESLDAARQAVYRLRDFKQMLEESVKNKQSDGSKIKDLLETTRKKFEAAMDDDLNISESLAAIFDLVREINKVKLNTTEAKSTLDLLNKFDTVLGILESNNENLGATVEKLIEERKMARENKNYQRSDEIRKELDEMGIVLEDTGPATRWKKKL
ncbi:MAG: cysteine--tRNA ligase, partial [Planctomycetes bacterium]|nr:cysteine--tRNA ligase [Planctomycetota bacterium]